MIGIDGSPFIAPTTKAKNIICLWFNKDAEEAARFYAANFPDNEVTAVHLAPLDYHSGKEGDVITVEFTVMGIACVALNGGPEFKHSEAFSFQVATDTQEKTDCHWNAIVRPPATPLLTCPAIPLQHRPLKANSSLRSSFFVLGL